jgi:hypothetical protein
MRVSRQLFQGELLRVDSLLTGSRDTDKALRYCECRCNESRDSEFCQHRDFLQSRLTIELSGAHADD